MKYSSTVGGTNFMAALHLTEGNTGTTRLIPERPGWIRKWSEIADRIISPYRYLGVDRWGT